MIVPLLLLLGGGYFLYQQVKKPAPPVPAPLVPGPAELIETPLGEEPPKPGEKLKDLQTKAKETAKKTKEAAKVGAEVLGTAAVAKKGYGEVAKVVGTPSAALAAATAAIAIAVTSAALTAKYVHTYRKSLSKREDWRANAIIAATELNKSHDDLQDLEYANDQLAGRIIELQEKVGLKPQATGQKMMLASRKAKREKQTWRVGLTKHSPKALAMRYMAMKRKAESEA